MSWPWYTGNVTAEPEGAPSLPPSLQAKLGEPAGYIPDEGLVHAANTALLLAQPLLLTGDPGCGKTRFAASLAFELGLGKHLEFRAKTSSKARDLLYVHDALARLQAGHAAGEGEVPPALRFIRLSALGEAILRAADPASVPEGIGPHFEHTGAKRHVVLIDEIDKAPRDFCNDLLTEIERMKFVLREVSDKDIQAQPDFHPVVVITSNSEQHLPPAFLRRCIYYHIPFPDEETLTRIVNARLKGILAMDDPELARSLELFEDLRKDELGLTKRPATAELLGWLLALSTALPEGQRLFDHPDEVVAITKSVLLKNKSDRNRGDEKITTYANDQK